jgi:hypothetical protein
METMGGGRMLRGSLTDLAIVDLVQIPVGNRKTGELLIATEERDARLYYVDGQLVHLVSGDLLGPRVLDLIVGWSDGEFEFRPDVLTEGTSFDGDLNRKLLAAVDNLKEAQELEQEAGRAVDAIRRLLFDFLSDNDYAIHACLMHEDGTMDVCGAERVDTPAWLETIRATVLELVASYPRRSLNRMLFEDGDGILVVSCYPEDRSALLVAAKQGATLGAVSMGVDRLARKIAHVKRT